MEKRHLLLALASAAAAPFAFAAPAQALPGFSLVSPTFALSGILGQDPCAGLSPGRLGLANGEPILPAMSKSAAILGGQPSQLELIARMQSGQVQAAAPTTALAKANVGPLPGQNVTPGSSGRCLGFVARGSAPGKAGLGAPVFGADDFLASKRLRVKHTSFDDAWNRVRSAGIPRRMTPSFARATAGAGKGTLAAVNAWTNDHIRYVEDQVLYGKADYWASASTTLQKRAGDCEDIAIAKMQLLARIGVARSDMYLTIARDGIRNADHAMLVVKMDGRWWLLDNSTDQLLDADQSNDYRPILSYSNATKWVHGF